ncbi:MAG: hypothetical protein ACYC2I_08265 [Elusimicrobiales bacterium]
MGAKFLGSEWFRGAFLVLRGTLTKFLWLLVLVLGFLLVFRVESGWRTVEISDLEREQILQLHSSFSFAPVYLNVVVEGDLDGKFSFWYGSAVDDTQYGGNIEAGGEFVKRYYGDWYNKCYIRYKPVEIKKDRHGRVGGIRVHYRYVDAWDYFAFLLGLGTLR